MELQEIKYFIEAALLAAGRPLSLDQLKGLFDGRSAPDKTELRKAIVELNEEYAERGIHIAEVASGFRIQIKAAMADRLQKLWEERPPRYSRALFETLALIAYRQPITRGEIEEVRGVSVSSNIIRTLMERDWVRVVGHRDVPGRPAMFGTTKGFLDYFGLKKLDDLPPLADLSDWENVRVQLNLPDVEQDVTEEPDLPPEIPVLEAEDDDEEFADADAAAAELPVDEHGLPVLDKEIGTLAEDPADMAVAEAPAAADEPVDEPADEAGAETAAAAEETRPDASAEPAEESAEVTELTPAEDADEELVVSEWPDPAESGRG